MTSIDATPSPTRPARTRRSRTVALALACAVVLGGTGCSLLSEGSPAVDSPPAPQSPAATMPSEPAVAAPVAPAEPEPAPQASAVEAFAERVQASLTALGTTAKTPNRSQLMAAMLEAGAVQEKVEMSIDITPTGLAVDAVEAAAPVDTQCVVGQVRAGVATVTILPILASGLCLVGDQH